MSGTLTARWDCTTDGVTAPCGECSACRNGLARCEDAVVKAILSGGGPAEGVVETQAVSLDGRTWTINVVHGNCACQWCAKVEGSTVVHVYERRDDDVFVYRESREPHNGDH